MTTSRSSIRPRSSRSPSTAEPRGTVRWYQGRENRRSYDPLPAWVPSGPDAKPVILSLGMGVESSAILLRWINDPSSRVINGRPFDLRDVIVMTAMTGSEKGITADLMRKHVLPAMRANDIRYIQLGRRGRVKAAGLAVLDDSRFPTEMYAKGIYTIEQEMTEGGSVPQGSYNNRQCSQKFKKDVLEPAIERLVGDNDYFHVIGYSVGEETRRGKDRSYTLEGRESSYPLFDWGWTRDDARQYLRSVVGEVETADGLWPKSACVFCPFAVHMDQKSNAEIFAYYKGKPEDALRALVMEYRSLSLNDRQPLLISRRLIDVLRQESGFEDLLQRFQDVVDNAPHGIYSTRRVHGAPVAYRSIRRLTDQGLPVRGTKAEMTERLHELARTSGIEGRVVDDGTTTRFVILERVDVPKRKRGKDAPAPDAPREPDHLTAQYEIVVAIEGAISKERKSFEPMWNKATGAQGDLLALLAAADNEGPTLETPTLV